MIYENGNLVDRIALGLASAASRTYTLEIDCVAGQFLSGESVSDIAVEARHGTGGGWTNIETTPIDMSTWAGSLETFQVRITADTITGDTTRMFTINVAGSIGSLVYTDDDDLLLNDDNDSIYS